MFMVTKRLMLLMFALLLAGCHAGYETRTYDVSVRNLSDGPITIWLTKDGAPYEPGWLAPEDLAIESPKQNAKLSGVIVPPDKTADTGVVKGQFESQTHAILRIYAGKRSFDQLLASTHGDPTRVDYPLHPGRSDLIIEGKQPIVHVKEENASP
jgi:hypothetical protein